MLNLCHGLPKTIHLHVLYAKRNSLGWFADIIVASAALVYATSVQGTEKLYLNPHTRACLFDGATNAVGPTVGSIKLSVEVSCTKHF